jgi:hypothetical protein
MDRFYYYLLGAMAAVLLVGVGFITFSRHKAVEEGTATPSPTPAFADLPKATPARPWSTPGIDPNASATPLLMATPAPTPIPWTRPDVGKTTPIIYPGFTVLYSLSLNTPLAAQYAMVQGAKPRTYAEPKKVPMLDSRLIAAAGYARGELAYAKSISLYFGSQASRNASLMTNVCAMDPGTAAGPWAKLSELERQYSGAYKWIEIVAGPILGNPVMGVGKLPVPVAFFRVYRREYGDCLAFIIPQGATSVKMETYLTDIATIEAATGISIFENTISVADRTQKAPAVW